MYLNEENKIYEKRGFHTGRGNYHIGSITARSGETYEVKNAKTRKDILGNEATNGDNPNVGIVLDDGAHMILTYDIEDPGFAFGDEIKHVAGLLPVGDGAEEFKNFTNTAMRGILF